MINLLPAERKRQILAARSNVLLTRYTLAMLAVVAILAVAIFVVNFLLTINKHDAEQTVTDNQAKVTNFAAVQSAASQFRTSLAKAKTLLDSEIDYAKVITETANLLPAGTALDELNLTAASFNTPITLSVKVKGEDQALALRNSFQSSLLYSNVSYGKLSTNTGDDAATYPYKIDLNVTLNKVSAQ